MGSEMCIRDSKDALVDDYCEHVSGSHMWSSIFGRDSFVDDVTLLAFCLSSMESLSMILLMIQLNGNLILMGSSLSSLFSCTSSFWLLNLFNHFPRPFPLQDYLEIFDST